MNINLQQDELEIAIEDYLRKTGVVNPPLTMVFVAGRKGNGVSCEITVAADTTEVPLRQINEEEDFAQHMKVEIANLVDETEEEESPFNMDTVISVANDANPFAIPTDVADFIREPQEPQELIIESVQSVDAETDEEEETVNVPPTNSIFD